MLKRMSFCDSEGSEVFDDILFGWKGENVSFVLFHLNRQGALLYCKRPKISEKNKTRHNPLPSLLLNVTTSTITYALKNDVMT